jgi:acetoin utilization deacetylase AcuC-like enzyme
MQVGFVYTPSMLEHQGRSKHPEKPARLTTILERVEKKRLLERCRPLLLPGKSGESQERLATDTELLAVHSAAHLKRVADATRAVVEAPNDTALREPHGDGAIYYHEATEHSARVAAGSVLVATEAALGNQVRSAFALVRPPGHHAERDEAMGFCFYNSAAVAAAAALRGFADSGTASSSSSAAPTRRTVSRVAIVDWDVHHGNGTQHIFEDDPNVLFISLHRFGRGFFPGTGAIDEVGTGAGRGRTVNVAWSQAGLGDADYAAAFALIVMPILREFDPQLLLISAGFDAAEGDVQGKMRMTPEGFACMAKQLLSLPTACAPVVVFEGGYHLEQSAACAEAVLAEMLEQCDEKARGRGSPAASTSTPLAGALGTLTESTLRQVIAVQREFWSCLRSDEHAASVESLFGQRGPRGCRKRTR